MADLQTVIGKVVLKNPVICGSGEHTMDETGIRAAIASGAGAVVAKSINESHARSAVGGVAVGLQGPARRDGVLSIRTDSAGVCALDAAVNRVGP